MAKPIINREKEPFERTSEPSPKPVRYGDDMADWTGVVSYQDQDDIVTARNREKLANEELRLGVPVEGDPYGATRIKQAGDYVFRKLPPYNFWRIYRADGDPTPSNLSGSYTTLELAERAAGTWK